MPYEILPPEDAAPAPAAGKWEILPPEEPPQSGWDKYKSNFKSMLPAPYQAALGAATGFGGMIAGGIGGLGRTLMTGDPSEGAATSRRVHDALTFEPTSESAKTALHYAGKPGEWLHKYGEFAGERGLERTGSPLIAAGLAAAPEVLPQILGMRLPGAKASAFERALPGGEFPGTPMKRTAAIAEALKSDTAALAAKDVGYSLPPTQVNPSIVNKVIEGAAGKIKTAQDLSTKNQPISNRLIRDNFDLPPDAPLTTETLAAVRKQAGQAYEPVRGAGRITASDKYGATLDSIEAPYKNAAKDFPDAPQSPVVDAVKTMRRETFDSSAALDQIQIMRDKADVAYRGGDKKLGGAYKGIANALEEEIGRHLEATGAPADVIDNFRNARQKIAQTYTVQKHLEPSGNIDAQGLARELDRKPLTGNIRTVAEFGSNFKKAAQLPEKIGGVPMSPLDYAGAAVPVVGAIASGNPMLALAGLAPFARPFVRKGLGSDFYQRNMVTPPTRGPSLGSRVVQGLQQPGVIPGLESLGLDARRQELLQQLLAQEGAPQ